MAGRPSIYSDELLDAICERLSEGEPLAQICRDPEINVAPRTVRQWANKMENVKEAVAQARILGYDAISEETLAIADGLLPDAEGKRDPTRDKLRVDTRLKLLAKWDPKRFGDASQIRLANADGDLLPDVAPMVSDIMALLRPSAPAKNDE